MRQSGVEDEVESINVARRSNENAIKRTGKTFNEC